MSTYILLLMVWNQPFILHIPGFPSREACVAAGQGWTHQDTYKMRTFECLEMPRRKKTL